MILHSIRDKIYGFHEESDAQSLIIAAIFVMVLVIMLTVTLNLSMVAYQKIQAQNAVDAAAMTGSVWQIRGCSFVQTLNNVIWVSDCVADVTLTAAVACNYFAWNPAGLAAGNVLLGISVGSHASAHYIMRPFRKISANYLFPGVCYLSGSEMAKVNGATPLLGLATYMSRLSNEIIARKVNIPGGSYGTPQITDEDYINSFIQGIPIYALGLEVGDEGGLDFISLHLTLKDADAIEDWPLHTELVTTRVSLCPALAPVVAVARSYYNHVTDNGSWSHDWYETEEAVKGNPARLPAVTWLSCVREEDKMPSRINLWTASWRQLGGLGVPLDAQEKTGYGELGSMAFASSRAYVDRVAKTKFSGSGGWVEMVPVKFGEQDDSLAFGICH